MLLFNGPLSVFTIIWTIHRGNTLQPLHRLLFLISSKRYFMYIPFRLLCNYLSKNAHFYDILIFIIAWFVNSTMSLFSFHFLNEI